MRQAGDVHVHDRGFTMLTSGASPDELRALATAFGRHAASLGRLEQDLLVLVKRADVWSGRDAEEFRHRFASVQRPGLVACRRSLDAAARTLGANAAAQEATSNELAGGGPGAGASGNPGTATLAGTTTMAATGDSDSTGSDEEEPPADAPRPSPSEIEREYQVSDSPMTEWPGEWDPMRLAVDPIPVTENEAELLDGLGLLNLQDFKDSKEDAYGESERRYDGAGAEDGHQDAFRHAYWNALMSTRIGPEFAEDFGTAHEQRPGNPSDREAMDLYNNEVGRRIAAENPDASAEELADKVQQAIENGDMVVIGPDGQLHRSDEVPVGDTGDADGAPAQGQEPDFNDSAVG